jgi:hypothetical protein
MQMPVLMGYLNPPNFPNPGTSSLKVTTIRNLCFGMGLPCPFPSAYNRLSLTKATIRK